MLETMTEELSRKGPSCRKAWISGELTSVRNGCRKCPPFVITSEMPNA